MLNNKKIGKYEVLDIIGHGASANVWLAKDPYLGCQVALKEFSNEHQDQRTLVTEAKLLYHLSHPNIVSVLSADIIDGRAIIAMEYVDGGNVSERLYNQVILNKQKYINLPIALKWTCQILNALQYAHARPRHVCHRDIKPSNVLVTSGDDVKLADFGSAMSIGTNDYLPGAGTYSYMAPEDFAGSPQSSFQSDIWAVGALLYLLLTGEHPFMPDVPTDWLAWKFAIETRVPSPLSSYRHLVPVPYGLQSVVDKALAKDKEERFKTADEFIDALKEHGLYLLPPSNEELKTETVFKATINRIDKRLRQLVRLPNKSGGLKEVIIGYAASHSDWNDLSKLLQLIELRNRMTHDILDAEKYFIVPTKAQLESLLSIEEGLTSRHPDISVLAQPKPRYRRTGTQEPTQTSAFATPKPDKASVQEEFAVGQHLPTEEASTVPTVSKQLISPETKEIVPDVRKEQESVVVPAVTSIILPKEPVIHLGAARPITASLDNRDTTGPNGQLSTNITKPVPDTPVKASVRKLKIVLWFVFNFSTACVFWYFTISHWHDGVEPFGMVPFYALVATIASIWVAVKTGFMNFSYGYCSLIFTLLLTIYFHPFRNSELTESHIVFPLNLWLPCITSAAVSLMVWFVPYGVGAIVVEDTLTTASISDIKQT